MLNRYRLVLFDFDGTFADTARDMVGALNRRREAHAKHRLAFESLRPHVSDGTPALIRIGFGCGPGEDGYDALRNQFLETYEAHLCDQTTVYPGIDEILECCQKSDVPWGIVTNKPEQLTVRIMQTLGYFERANVIIGGDSLPQRKPHPMPILHACKHIGVNPQSTVFIGDSIRDIEAGRKANTDTIAVTYGYVPPGDKPVEWNADYLADSVSEVLEILTQRASTPS